MAWLESLKKAPDGCKVKKKKKKKKRLVETDGFCIDPLRSRFGLVAQWKVAGRND